MKNAVRVDIIAFAPTAFFHCRHCEVAFHHLGIGPQMRRTEADESLPPELQLEYLDLSAWARDLHQRHGENVAIRVIGAASVAGVWTSLRHGVRSYPAVVVRGGLNHRDRIEGDYRSLDPVIDQLVTERVSGVNQ